MKTLLTVALVSLLAVTTAQAQSRGDANNTGAFRQKGYESSGSLTRDAVRKRTASGSFRKRPGGTVSYHGYLNSLRRTFRQGPGAFASRINADAKKKVVE